MKQNFFARLIGATICVSAAMMVGVSAQNTGNQPKWLCAHPEQAKVISSISTLYFSTQVDIGLLGCRSGDKLITCNFVLTNKSYRIQFPLKGIPFYAKLRDKFKIYHESVQFFLFDGRCQEVESIDLFPDESVLFTQSFGGETEGVTEFVIIMNGEHLVGSIER
ncbi:hypothetical protein KKP04_12345 [Rhodomicrobium sp. Az07]|uniref:hypothetical protein n=1 Tax=Rhodomicrobium sp. Az07 TaxID=2839034 RepID=UPI001BEB2B81|nr:hypothetical protein [Rhodomicrobium sp. Az07]MBT3071656.1 hypothetical protein [Rhodomicrobium sp. Az07]